LKIIAFAIFLILAVFFDSIEAQAILFAILLALLLAAGFRSFKTLFFGIIPFLLLADFGFWIFLQGTTIDLAHLIAVSNMRIFNLIMASCFFFFSTDVFALVKLLKKIRTPEIIFYPFLYY